MGHGASENELAVSLGHRGAQFENHWFSLFYNSLLVDLYVNTRCRPTSKA